MKKILPLFSFLIISFIAISQNTTQAGSLDVAHVDKKTKEFFVASNPKAEYKIFGYEYPNITTRKMVKCPLGSYFDSGKMKEGDRIIYMGKAGSFSKMMFISGSGKKTTFYFPKGSFTIK